MPKTAPKLKNLEKKTLIILNFKPWTLEQTLEQTLEIGKLSNFMAKIAPKPKNLQKKTLIILNLMPKTLEL